MKSLVVVCVFVLTAVYFLWRTFLPALTSMTHSYPAYYTASRLIVEGRWSAQVYDDHWFEARVLEMTQGRVSDHFSLHPPTTSLLLVPLAWLDLTTARVLWQLFNLVLLGAALGLLVSALGMYSVVPRLVFFSFALLYPPLAENIRVGQSYVMLLFLFTLALWSELRGKPFITALGLGLAAGIKLSGVPLWLVLAARREWRVLLWSIGVAFASALVGLGALGWEGWLAFFKRVVDYSQPVPLAAHVAFQTTPSFFQRMFVASSEFNPTPLFDAPLLAPLVNFGLVALALGAMLWYARRAALEFAFAAAVTCGVILFPMAAEYHYTLLFIPLAVMSAHIWNTRHRVEALWLGVILILLYVPFDWNAPRWSTREWMFLAYPRLYAGWLLWLWLLKQMWQERAPAGVRSPSSAIP